jgi:hypothetical protein
MQNALNLSNSQPGERDRKALRYDRLRGIRKLAVIKFHDSFFVSIHIVSLQKIYTASKPYVKGGKLLSDGFGGSFSDPSR